MPTITVGFSKPKNFTIYSWLIMNAYNIPYDHVYIKFWSNEFEDFIIYQASNSMLNFMGTQFYLSEVVIDEFKLHISEENLLKMHQFALETAGKPYGYKEAIGLGIVRLFELFGKKIKNPLGSGGTYVCSTLVAHVLKDYIDININGQVDDMSPKEIFELMMKVKNAQNE